MKSVISSDELYYLYRPIKKIENKGTTMQPIKLYWFQGTNEAGKNFGDWLSPKLCEAISGRQVVHTPIKNCDIIAIGSIIHRLKNHFWSHQVHVWGAGLIEERPQFKTPHHIHAVRGRLTADKLTNKQVEVLGDPGLLSDILLTDRRIEKRFRVGIIPHYTDHRHPFVTEFSHQKGVTVINVFSETIDFLQQVSQCEIILSTSLHGLIIADALNIPNGWIKLSDNIRGKDFKFADYYSIFGLNDVKPIYFSATSKISDYVQTYESWQRPNLDHIKQLLIKSFPL